MPALAVQGVSSSAGKSLVATALCRWFARLGLRVAPFKGSNMSTHARVTPDGEIGVAQWLQARAAGVAPEARMNPVLVKPEAHGSQVVRLGRVDAAVTATPWRERAPLLWDTVETSLRSLLDDFDLVVIEGAGSPAETNLRHVDLANMRVAAVADAPVILVADIDRGGAFAHLYGTWALLEPDERARLAGFVLNKFRGDASLLAPAPAELAARTGMADLGVLPWLDHGLPDEDGSALGGRGRASPAAAVDGLGDRPTARPRVAVLRYPTASNLDEFAALAQVVDLVWAGAPHDLSGADLVILPGSKHVMADLAWLRSRGLDAAVTAAADRGQRVLGICGGMQMLGASVHDPHGVEGAGTGGGWAGAAPSTWPPPAGTASRADGAVAGLGLLSVTTTFAADKRVEHHRSGFLRLPPPWAALSGHAVTGYEIRYGETRGREGGGPAAATVAALPEGRGFARGPVLGVSVHGLLEDPALVRRLLGVEIADALDPVLDALADAVTTHLDGAALRRLVEPA